MGSENPDKDPRGTPSPLPYVRALIFACPLSTSELASHNVNNDPNNVYTSIRGEVFDLTEIAAVHTRRINVVPSKVILKYGGVAADDIFPVQVSFLSSFYLVG